VAKEAKAEVKEESVDSLDDSIFVEEDRNLSVLSFTKRQPVPSSRVLHPKGNGCLDAGNFMPTAAILSSVPNALKKNPLKPEKEKAVTEESLQFSSPPSNNGNEENENVPNCANAVLSLVPVEKEKKPKRF